MSVITTDQLYYNKDTRTFSAEISDLSHLKIVQNIFIHNPKTGVSKKYDFRKMDRDSSGEDIYGWWYENKETETKLLLIND